MKNFRELAFGNIKDKLLYRGEALNKLSKKDKNYLINESNIKTVIDLRTLEEHNKQKDKILPNVSYYHIPLVTLDEMGVSSEKDGKKQASKSKLPSMYDYYYKLIDKNKKDKWSEIFNILLKCEGGVYIHCTVGKDRTGVVVAVILKLLGVSEKLIYDDYLKTNEHPIYPFKYKLFSLTLKKETRKEFNELFKVRKEYLDFFFEKIDLDFGSFDNFLKEMCSLDNEKTQLLKNKFLKEL